MISDLLQSFNSEQIELDPGKINQYLQNVCGVQRHILGIFYPTSENDIQKLIELNIQLKIPLYPISRGNNYGLGSRLPTTHNHLVIDFKRMNRILSFDDELGIIQIEPGVTQQDVSSFLDEINADFILNTTGSSAESSLIGNALERGIGHYGSRVPEVISLDIILGSGEKLTTNILNSGYSYGLGPDLKGLFFQSNFGILTAMTFRLLPKTQSVACVALEKNASIPLECFIDQLRIAKNKQLLPENLHISNRLRKLSVITPLLARQMNLSMKDADEIAKQHVQCDWSVTASFRGEKKVLEAQIACLNSFMKPYAKLKTVFDDDLKKSNDPLLLAMRNTFGHALGQPSSDALLSLGYHLQETSFERIEESNIGTLFLIPVIPFKGKNLSELVGCIMSEFNHFHFEPYITFNLVEHINLEGVINLTFFRNDPNAVSEAHLCIQQSLAQLENLGYPPMRLSIFQQSSFLYKNEVFKKIRHQLKNMLDPHNLIAHGRY